MADTPQPGTGLSELLRHFTPYAPIVAGAVMSMAFGERLTIRGKVLSAVVGLGAAFWIAPALCDVAALFWPGDALPTSIVAVIGLACGAFGMVILAGLAQALARYAKDPLSLVRVQIGGVIITAGAKDAEAGQ